MKIQIAIDYPDLESAITYVDSFRDELDVIYEYGAPLVVNEGVNGFRVLRQSNHLMTYVDCKTMDFPEMEWRRYIDCGATEITGMLFAEDSVVLEMARVQEKYGITVCVSTMGYPIELLDERVRKFIDLGFNCYVVHAAHSERMKAFSQVKKQLDLLSKLEKIQLFAAGGIGPDNISSLVEYPIDRVIVGRGIALNHDRRAALERIRSQVYRSTD